MIDTLSYNLNLVLIKINIFTSYLISLNRASAFANVFTIIINNILFLQQDSCLTKVSSIVWQQKGQYIKLRLSKPSWIFQLQLLQFYTHIYIYITTDFIFKKLRLNIVDTILVTFRSFVHTKRHLDKLNFFIKMYTLLIFLLIKIKLWYAYHWLKIIWQSHDFITIKQKNILLWPFFVSTSCLSEN